MVSFWFDSEDLSTSDLCARIYVEASVFIDSFRIHDIRNQDDNRTFALEDLNEADKGQVTRELYSRIKELNDGMWGKWVWGRDGI